jgi:glycine/D-amino acid oxidase-like deaminating enzyme
MPFPSHADAVVIGTGAFGLSVTLQLARMGLRSVVALDRYPIASQTSPRAAGLFKLVQADELRTRLARLAVETVMHFERDFGVTLPYVRSGSLMVARTERHARVIEQEVSDAQRWGADVHRVSAREAQALAPFLQAESILRAAYVPGDIYIEEPVSLLNAFREAAELLGARIIGNVPVIGIDVRDSAVRAVLTPEGTIQTDIVIDAAGAWVRAVARLAGTDLAVQPMRHQLAITQPISGTRSEQAIVRIFDAAVYVRPCRGGLMWGGFEANPLPFDPTAHGDDFRIEMTPLDFGILQQCAESVRNVVPVLHDVPVQEHRGGLFTMTPDGRFVVGPVPAVRGFWVLSGCNGSGFSFSPALGRLLAEWIVQGQPSVDLAAFAPARLAGVVDEASLREAAIFQYTHYYEPLGE